VSDRLIDNKNVKRIKIRIRHAHTVYEEFEPPEGFSYTISPDPYADQTLETKGKIMSNDLTFKRIPFYDTSNPYGGKTVYIGKESE